MTNPITTFSALTSPIAAGSTFVYTALIQDASNPPQPVGSGALTALTLSITDEDTGAVVNNCDQQNILNAGRGVVDPAGNLSITFLPDDTAILRPGDKSEVRWMTIDFSYPGPAGPATGRHAVSFTVVAMPGN